MGPLTNKRHEAFARHVASGMSQSAAWRKTHPKSRGSDSTVWGHSCRLAARPEVSDRIDELMKRAESAAVATSRELQEFLTRVVRTPVGKLSSMSDLVQEVERNGRTRRVKMPSKLEAIDRLAKLLGYYVAEKSEQVVRIAGVEAMTDEELEEIARGGT